MSPHIADLRARVQAAASRVQNLIVPKTHPTDAERAALELAEAALDLAAFHHVAPAGADYIEGDPRQQAADPRQHRQDNRRRWPF